MAMPRALQEQRVNLTQTRHFSFQLLELRFAHDAGLGIARRDVMLKGLMSPLVSVKARDASSTAIHSTI